MDYKLLGQTGLTVSRICLGTAFRSNMYSGNLDTASCVRVVHHALDLGINFVDTANAYSYGWSEEVVGEALRGKRDNVVLATKVFSGVNTNPKANDSGLSRYHILREVENSLRRMQTDHIDLYWLHSFDANTPIDETLRAMDDLIHQGKVRYIGCCNFPAWRVCHALWRSDALHLNSFVAVQNSYSLLMRPEMEPDLLGLCRSLGLGAVTYSPLAIGLLSGRFRHGQPAPADTPWATQPHYQERLPQLMTEQADKVVQALIDIGQAHSKTPSQVAMAWLLAQPEITAVISGPDTIEQIEEATGACGWTLTDAERDQLTTLSQPSKPVHIG